MARYIEVSGNIYSIYLRYVAPEDIHVYSVDEVFIDIRPYRNLYHMTARTLAAAMVREVLAETGITATAGIGTNMYLAKVAMDIVAKKQPADADGVRIAELDEERYRDLLWDHLPLTDFWQIGSGTVRRLSGAGLRTMGDIARCSLGSRSDFYNEDTLFRLFGVNAELLIDHAWGQESCTMADIKGYRPSSKSVGIGQVLPRSYSCGELKIIVREMTEQLVYDLVGKELLTDAIVLHIGYDKENVGEGLRGATRTDHYGRRIPRSAHGTANLGSPTASLKQIMAGTMELFERIVDSGMTARRVTVTAIRVLAEQDVPRQMDLFRDTRDEEQEMRLQKAILRLQKRYGKNAVLKGHDYQTGATTRERNAQIGGHRA